MRVEDDLNEGWICLHRKLLNSQVFQSEGLLKLWIWCLLKANYKDQWVPIKTGRGQTEVLVRRGQFIFGQKTASKELKMPPRTLYDRMQKLARMQNLAIQPATHYSIITIQNYNLYQDEGIMNPPPNPLTNHQPTATTNNIKQTDDIWVEKSTLLRAHKEEQMVSKIKPEEILDLYHKLCPNLPRIRLLTKERKEKVLTRLKSYPELEFWREVFEKANRSAIPPNEGHPKGWKPDFDYLIRNDTNPIKVLEGKFIPKPKSSW